MLFPKVILLVGVVCLISFPVFSQQQDAVLIGDTDASGKLDIVDALLMAQHSVGAVFIQEEFNLDVNRDRGYNIVDALLIAQRYVGAIDKMPAEKYYDDLRNQLEENKKLWQSQGVSYYKIRQLFSCHCLYAGTNYDVYVRDGELSEFIESDTGLLPEIKQFAFLDDVDGLFERVGMALSNKHNIQNLEFNSRWGFPESISVDQYYMMADDEWSIYTSDLEVLPVVQPTELLPEVLLKDWSNLLSAEIVDDSLQLHMEVSGGCGEHEFVLFSQTSFAESLPVQLYLFLKHDGSDDFCEAIIQESRSFGLSSVVDLYEKNYGSRTGTVVLNIFDPMVNTPGPLYSLTYDF